MLFNVSRNRNLSHYQLHRSFQGIMFRLLLTFGLVLQLGDSQTTVYEPLKKGKINKIKTFVQVSSKYPDLINQLINKRI